MDNNSTTAVDERVLSKMLPFFLRVYGNTSSRDHSFGWDAAEAVEEARFHVAALTKAKANEIVFTSGATEGICAAIKGVVAANRGQPSKALTAASEHDAVLDTCGQLSRLCNVEVIYSPVDRIGHITCRDLELQLGKLPGALVVLMFANNELGNLHSIQEFAKVARGLDSLFLSDLTQAVGKVAIDVEELGVDFAAFSAHKIYGPKGVGALYIKGGREILIEQLISGGGQERGLRAGTLNVPGIVGFGEACRIAAEEMPEESARVTKLRDKLETAILSQVPDTWVNGDPASRIGNTTNIGFRGVEAKVLIRDMHDIAVSTQAACSTGAKGPSHVLKAIGLTDEEAYSCIRFSLGRFTTEEEIDYTIGKVLTSVHKLRKHR